jgi:Zn finger protein HypA/HybF involved in hydrogenase expression
VARSTLWGLTKATNEELSALQAILNDLIDQAMQTENSSVRRLTLNIIERLKMNENDMRTDFLDFCFEHMVSIEEYPGIQTLCMKLAYRMCTFYPELMDELKRTIDAMEIDYYKPAVKCLRKRILSGKYR